MIRVVIAEDQAMVLGALAALLETEPGIEVVGRASTGDAALSLVRGLAPDVLVTDIEMPGSSGLDVAAEVARAAGLPATRAGRRCVGVPAEGCAVGAAGRGHPPRARGRPRDRSGAGGRCMD